VINTRLSLQHSNKWELNVAHATQLRFTRVLTCLLKTSCIQRS